MPRRRYLTTALAACCALSAVAAVPSVASAHGSIGGRRHHYMSFQARAAQLCAQAGVPLNGSAHWIGHGLSGLSETRLKELKAACEKLAAAYSAQRKSDEAAAKALQEARKTDRSKLGEACPALAQPSMPWMHHLDYGELSTACKEAVKKYFASVGEAQKAFYKAVQEAHKPFRAALEEFEKAVKPILAVLQAAAQSHMQATPGPWPSPGHGTYGGGYWQH